MNTPLFSGGKNEHELPSKIAVIFFEFVRAPLPEERRVSVVDRIDDGYSTVPGKGSRTMKNDGSSLWVVCAAAAVPPDEPQHGRRNNFYTDDPFVLVPLDRGVSPNTLAFHAESVINATRRRPQYERAALSAKPPPRVGPTSTHET